MAFDPLCGRGITEALLSGVEVADWLVQSSHTKIEGLPIWATNAAERFNSYCAQRATTAQRDDGRHGLLAKAWSRPCDSCG